MWIIVLVVAAVMGHSLATQPAHRFTEQERVFRMLQCVKATMEQPDVVIRDDGHDFDHCQPITKQITIRPRIGG